MAVNVTMPKWGLTMKEGRISKWFKSEGDTIQKGEPFFEVETEKITNVVEAIADGILFQIVVSADTTVPVGTIVAVIAEPGEKPERIEGLQAGEVVEEKRRLPPEDLRRLRLKSPLQKNSYRHRRRRVGWPRNWVSIWHR